MGKGTVVRGLQLASRSAAAAGLAVAAAERLALPFPIYAMIAAVIVTDLSPVQTRKLGVPRVAGTIVGSAVGATLSATLGGGAIGIAIGVLIAAFLGHLVRADAAKLSGYVCAIVLLQQGVNPWSYAWYRLIETLLGIAMAILVSMVPLLIHEERVSVP